LVGGGGTDTLLLKAESGNGSAGLNVTSDAIADATTTVTVSNGLAVAADLPADGSGLVIQIGSEQMLVTAVTGNVLAVERGYDGTMAAPHGNNALVLLPGTVAPLATPKDYEMYLNQSGAANQYTATLSTLRFGTTAAGSATVTGIDDTSGLALRQAVTGPGVPTGTTIAAIPSSTSITLSNAAKLSQGNLPLTFGTVGGIALTLPGNIPNIQLEGGPGNNLIQVDPSVTRDVTIYGGPGHNVLMAGSGNDTLIAGPGTAVLYGGTGDDALYGGDLPTQDVPPTAGADPALTVTNNAGAVDGNDTLIAGSGNDELIAGSGNDLLIGGSVAQVVNPVAGTPGVALLQNGQYQLIEGAGRDILAGGAGNDVLIAGPGSPGAVLEAGTGNNTLIAQNYGVNTLSGGSTGQSLLLGGNLENFEISNSAAGGGNTLVGGLGIDNLQAGSGNDALYASYNARAWSQGEADAAADGVHIVPPQLFQGDSTAAQLQALLQAQQSGPLTQAQQNQLIALLTTEFNALSAEEGSLNTQVSNFLALPNLSQNATLKAQLIGVATQDEFVQTETAALLNQILNALGAEGFQEDRLIGGSGTDRFYGNIEGATWMGGGSGNQTFYNYNASDTVQGNHTALNTLVVQDYVGNNAIELSQDAGNVNAADFTINGQTPLLVGDTGNVSGIQTLEIQLGAGNDMVTVNLSTLPPGLSGLEVLCGSGNDVVDASAFTGQETLSGGAGDDFIKVGAIIGNTSKLDGTPTTELDIDLQNGSGSNTVTVNSKTGLTINSFDQSGNELSSTDEPLAKLVNFGKLVVVGGAGSNTFSTDGLIPSVKLQGGSGSNNFSVTGGTATLLGGSGQNTFTLVGPGNYTVDGGSGTNALVIDGDNNEPGLVGDTVSLTQAGSTVAVDGHTQVAGSPVIDLPISAIATNVSSVSLSGGAGDDYLDASETSMAVTLSGGSGSGADTLIGGTGSDTFDYSGAGSTYEGGTGADNTFVYAAANNATIYESLPVLSVNGQTIYVGNMSRIENFLVTGSPASVNGTQQLLWPVDDDSSVTGAAVNGIVPASAALSQARYGMTVATVGNYAIFAGGYNGAGSSNAVDIYDASTGQWSASSLSPETEFLSTATVGDYAIFASTFAPPDWGDAVEIFDAGAPVGSQWSSTTLPSGVARYDMAVATVGNYAIFAGGDSISGYSNAVDIYDASKGVWSTAALSQRSMPTAVATVGNYAIFAGGANADGSSNDAVDIFDASTCEWLPGTTLPSGVGRYDIAVATVGNYAIFAGGLSDNGYSNAVDIFNAGTGQWLPSTTTLSQARNGMAVETVGNYAIFAGGESASGATSAVDIFNAGTGKWVPSSTALSQAREGIAVATVGNYAIFAGGYYATSNSYFDSPSGAVDIFSASTGQWLSPTTLSHARGDIAAATVGNDAIFAGGGAPGTSNAVDIFDAGAVKWSTAALSQAGANLSVATVGTQAIFAGLSAASGPSSTVDIYNANTGFSDTTSVLNAEFYDSLSYASASAEAATINWGDGTTSTGTISYSGSGNFSITSSHIYATNTSHTISLTISDSFNSPGAAATLGTNYSGGLQLDNQGNLLSFNVTASTTVDTDVRSYLADNNTSFPMLITLHTDGSLWVVGASSSFDESVEAMLLRPDGTLDAFHTPPSGQPSDGANLDEFAPGTTTDPTVISNVVKLVEDNNGVLYRLDADRSLYELVPGRTWTLVQQNVQSVSIDSNDGTKIDVLDENGDYLTFDGAVWSLIAVPQFAVGASATTTAGNLIPVNLSVVTMVIGQAVTDAQYTGTVQIGVTGGSSQTYTFTASDGGTHAFNLVDDTSGTQTLTVTDNGGLTASAALTVSPGDAVQFSVDPPPVEVGAAAPVTVTAYDAYGNVATGYSGPVTLTTVDNAAASPITSYSPTSPGTYDFSVDFSQPGGQKLVATGGSLAGDGAIVVTPGPYDLSRSTVSVSPSSVEAGGQVAVTLTVRDALGNQETSGSLTVAFALAPGSTTGGNFGPTMDDGDGTYTALFTAAAVPGLANFTATIGGTAVTSSPAAVIVEKATPTIKWASPGDITYGTVLGIAQLDATAPVAGAFTYTPAAGTILDAGANQTLTATFTPVDGTDYTGATATVTINVDQATPKLSVNSVNLIYGTALANSQLNGTSTWTVAGNTVTVPGFFTYTSVAGTVLGVGNGQLESVTFMPADSMDYTTVAATVLVNVAQASPLLSVNPVNLTYGTALANGQLSGITTWTVGGNLLTVPGSFAYTSAAGTVLGAGNGQLESVTFAPTDSTEYDTVSAMATINVAPAPLTITAVNATKLVGQPNPPFTVQYGGFVLGQGPSVLNGALIVTSPASAASTIGSYPIVPAGLSSPNYAITYVDGTLTVNGPIGPTAVGHSYAVATNRTLSVGAPGVLAGDLPGNQVPLTAILMSRPAHGTLTLKTNGSFVYKPNRNFRGTDKFTYEAVSGRLRSGTATVTLVVGAPVKKAQPKARTSSSLTRSDAEAIAFIEPAVAQTGKQGALFRASRKLDESAIHDLARSLVASPSTSRLSRLAARKKASLT
jgi:Ca2+-binding RTX toxin-like protein